MTILETFSGLLGRRSDVDQAAVWAEDSAVDSAAGGSSPRVVCRWVHDADGRLMSIWTRPTA
jgi:hypothetical protein